MYAILGGLYGALLSLMNLFNADLSAVYGNWASTVMIHAVGLLVLLPLAFTWGKRRAPAPWYLYLGGVIGIATVVFVNIGVSGIGVTANLVVMLLGQLVCSTIIDHFGWFGALRVKVTPMKLLCLTIIAAGDVLMLVMGGGFAGSGMTEVLAIAVSFLSGFTMVFARIANAGLAQRSGVGYSTVMNYVTGLGGSFLVFACTGFRMASAFPAAGQSVLIYIGGALGALGIFLCNVVTPRLPSLQLALVIFVGQIFSGMALDGLMGKFSLGTLVGGIIVAAGMLMNMRVDAKEVGALGNPAKPEKP